MCPALTQAGLGCLRAAGRGWWIPADPASCFTPLVPGPIQVEELGCLEVQDEATADNSEAAVPGQPPALVSRARAQFLGGGVYGGTGGRDLLTPK